jgi:hypothetical protein
MHDYLGCLECSLGEIVAKQSQGTRYTDPIISFLNFDMFLFLIFLNTIFILVCAAYLLTPINKQENILITVTVINLILHDFLVHNFVTDTIIIGTKGAAISTVPSVPHCGYVIRYRTPALVVNLVYRTDLSLFFRTPFLLLFGFL